MYKNVMTISAEGVGTVGLFNSEADFRSGEAPAATLEIQAIGPREQWLFELESQADLAVFPEPSPLLS